MSVPSKPPAERPSRPRVPLSRLDRLARRAAAVLALERAWPGVVLACVSVAVFVTFGWLGLWVAAPRALRIVGVLALAAGLGLSVFLVLRSTRVTRRDALARLDRDSGQGHRLVSTLDDQLAAGGQDPFTRALWEVQRRRQEAALARVALRGPAPQLARRDPYAIRLLALVALVAAGFVAGRDKDGLVTAAFDWRGGIAGGPGFRVDAWVDPPAYTGKPPVVLTTAGAGADHQSVTVPIHSTVVVRTAGGGTLAATASGGLKRVEPSAKPSPGTKDSAATPSAGSSPAPGEQRFTLDGDGRLELAHDGRNLATLALTAIPDRPPTVTVTGTPEPTDRGGLTVGYKIEDDYGVASADAGFTDPRVENRPMVRSLVPPPKLALNLPPTPGGLGDGRTTGDLSDHPWAGAEVSMTLSAKDEGGNVGLSAPVRIRLPMRPFHNPLARALVEQRRDLVFDPDHHAGVAAALDALMIAPDTFGTTKSVYLGLYTARQRLEAANTDAELIDLSDFLWQMALRIEEGDSSEAARDLRAAEQALREALQRNASPEEIRKLTEALRQQMEKFLAEMARNAQSAQNQPPPGPNTRTVTPQQLQRMMQQMEERAQQGDTAEAQRMLDQLQAMLDNLKSATNGRRQQQAGEMNRQLSELDKMTREQQALRDQTFQQQTEDQPGAPSDQDQDGDQQAGNDDGQDPSGDNQTPQQGGPQPNGNKGGQQALQGQQQALRQRLQDLQNRMRQLGLKGEKGLQDAEQAMKDAERALGQGDKGQRSAVDAQGRALQGLQQGANGLAQQMAEAGQGSQQGQGEGNGGSSVSQGTAGEQGQDPLGRPREGRGTMETRGRALDESVAARAQRVLQELRRRLGDPSRPSEEMDYLQRLLQPF